MSRIRYLEKLLKTATIISDDSKEDEVGLNKTVDIYFEEDDEVLTYKIVSTMRGDSMSGRISNESPIGRALMGHKVGDRVFVKVGESGGYYVQIRALDKTSDDSDALRKF